MAIDTPVTELRSWAAGLLTTEAATELLIRTNFAQAWRPWVAERSNDGYWIDFEAIPQHVGELSGGERRLLMLAASLGAGWGEGVAVRLEDTVPGLDHNLMRLVLAAIAHAGRAGDLFPWP